MSEIKLNQEFINALQNCTLSDEDLEKVRGGNSGGTDAMPNFLQNTDWKQVFNWFNDFDNYVSK